VRHLLTGPWFFDNEKDKIVNFPQRNDFESTKIQSAECLSFGKYPVAPFSYRKINFLQDRHFGENPPPDKIKKENDVSDTSGVFI
jgi:hypothetical protein